MSVTIQDDHGELKRHIANLIGSDPSRYADSMGTERHKRLTADEVARIADRLGLGLEDEPKQIQMDSIMLKLGRDHRTGVAMWDSSDLVAVIEFIEDSAPEHEVGSDE